MKALPGITMLDLRENSITHFEDPTQYLVGRSWQYTVDLGENPLDCESNLAWVVSAWHVLGDAICSTPVCVNGSAIRTMSKYRVRSWDNGMHCMSCYRQISNISRTQTQNCNISRLLKPGVKPKMGCNWSSADIWVINNFIVYLCAFYVRGFMVYPYTWCPTCITHSWTLLCVHYIVISHIIIMVVPLTQGLWNRGYHIFLWGWGGVGERGGDMSFTSQKLLRSEQWHPSQWHLSLSFPIIPVGRPGCAPSPDICSFHRFNVLNAINLFVERNERAYLLSM